MKILYAGRIEKVRRGDYSYSIISYGDFMTLLEKGYSRKKARSLGIGSKLWNNSYEHHLTPKQREEYRVKRIRKVNKDERILIWGTYLSKLEKSFPGIYKTFTENLEDHPEVILGEIDRLNDLYYETKEFISITKKWIRQACKRRGIPPIRLVSNLSEYKVKRVLLELGYKPEVQFRVGKYSYDFKVDNYVIEFDGDQYHTDLRDLPKEKALGDLGLTLIRIENSEIHDLNRLSKRLEKCLLGLK